jgi:uncharacterized membrane protein
MINLDFFSFILLSITLFIGTFTRFSLKYILKKVDSPTYFSITQLWFLLVTIVLISLGKVNWKSVSKLNNRDKGLLAIIPILVTISIFIYYHLLNRFEISRILPLISALRNILFLIFGALIFGEKITQLKMMGVFFITIGVIALGL